MGYMRHHAIIVTSWDVALLREAHAMAREIFGSDIDGLGGGAGLVTDSGRTVINGYESFAILPDGSKEEWEASDACDALRAKFISWLRAQCYSDGSSALQWVEVEFGGDRPEARVTAASIDDEMIAAYIDDRAEAWASEQDTGEQP